MNNRGSHLFFSLLIAGLGALGAGCASSGGASGGPSGQPAGPIELDGTKWKLTLNNGSFDGREIQFKKEGSKFLTGSLTEVGRQMRNNTAAHPGVWIFQIFLPAVSENTYRGIYRPPGSMESEATFSVSADGKLLRCSLMESNWFRQD
jgi:hypothetical protein